MMLPPLRTVEILPEVNIEEKLKSFICQRCGECCRQPGYVYLSERDADRASAYLKLDSREFVERFCEVVDRRRLVLKKHKDETCVFLTKDGCDIHTAKPAQCMEFPVKWRTPKSFDYCQGMKKIGLTNA